MPAARVTATALTAGHRQVKVLLIYLMQSKIGKLPDNLRL
jgi:hypothetical protein